MNFNKLGLVALSTAAIFMATSCNKTQSSILVTKQDMVEWVGKHYKKGEEPIKKQTVNADFSATTGTKARETIVEIMKALDVELNEDRKCNKTYTEGLGNMPHLYKESAERLKGTFNAAIVIDGKLTIVSSIKAEPEPEQLFEMDQTETYNTKGVKVAQTVNVESVLGPTEDEGTIIGYCKITYAY